MLFSLFQLNQFIGCEQNNADARAAFLINLQCAFFCPLYHIKLTRGPHWLGKPQLCAPVLDCVHPTCFLPTWNIWREQPPVAIATLCLQSHEKCPLQVRKRSAEISPNYLIVSLLTVLFPSIFEEADLKR